MISLTEVQQKVSRLYERKLPEWVVFGAESPVVDMPLYPPTQDQVLKEPAAAADWIKDWRVVERGLGDGGRVVWAYRQWANAGTQRMPTRLVLDDPHDVASFTGSKGHWQAAESRIAELRALLETHRVSADSTSVESIPDVLRRRAKRCAALDQGEYVRVRDSLAWLLGNPRPGVYPRQMPIRGVDSKWLEKHSALVEPLYAAATGTGSLGLLESPGLIRLRVLDGSLAPGGLGDFAAPESQLSRLDLVPRAVVVVENLQTLLALPAMEGVVALHSAGYAAKKLTAISWLAQTPVLYWGDLDVDGFRILSTVRGALGQTQSVLMDRSTLKEHLDLAGRDRKDAPRAMPEHLTAAERDAFAALSEFGQVRLEQERIPWEYALGMLQSSLSRGPAAHLRC